MICNHNVVPPSQGFASLRKTTPGREVREKTWKIEEDRTRRD
jgi:hypothetical protein